MRTVASARREGELQSEAKWKPGEKLEEVVQRVTYRHKLKGQTDRRGLGHKVYKDVPVDRKELGKALSGDVDPIARDLRVWHRQTRQRSECDQ